MKDVTKCRINSIACGERDGEREKECYCETEIKYQGLALSVVLHLPCTVLFIPLVSQSRYDFPNNPIAALANNA